LSILVGVTKVTYLLWMVEMTSGSSFKANEQPEGIKVRVRLRDLQADWLK